MLGPDAAETDLGDPQVRSDVLERDTFEHIRVFLQQVGIPDFS